MNLRMGAESSWPTPMSTRATPSTTRTSPSIQPKIPRSTSTSSPTTTTGAPTGHRPRVWDQCQGKVDAVVVGVGSGALTGVASTSKKNPNITVVWATPSADHRALVNEGRGHRRLVDDRGHGRDFDPRCATSTSRTGHRRDGQGRVPRRPRTAAGGHLAGSSARRCCAAMVCGQEPAQTVVTFICDSGAKVPEQDVQRLLDDGPGLPGQKTGDLAPDRAATRSARTTVSPMDPVARRTNMCSTACRRWRSSSPRAPEARTPSSAYRNDILLAMDRAGGDAKLSSAPCASS